MSHPEQLAFFADIAARNVDMVTGGRVLEVGSHDVNGGIRSLFSSADEYVGVDLSPGPGVDIVDYGHRLAFEDGYFDVTISGECFEHDPHWPETFKNMARMTKPGGMVAFTCASRGRPEHGTRRTDPLDSPGTQSEGIDYYQNLTANDFKALQPKQMFDEYRFWYVSSHFDLFFAGVRTGGSGGRIPGDSSVSRIRRMMPWPQRLVRLPLRLALRVVPEPRYQALILPYWNTMRRLRDASTTVVGESPRSANAGH